MGRGIINDWFRIKLAYARGERGRERGRDRGRERQVEIESYSFLLRLLVASRGRSCWVLLIGTLESVWPMETYGYILVQTMQAGPSTGILSLPVPPVFVGGRVHNKLAVWVALVVSKHSHWTLLKTQTWEFDVRVQVQPPITSPAK